MATVFENVDYIRQAKYGEQVRTAIADSIEQCYADATGDPNSLASIIKALFGGKGIGDVVLGENTSSLNSRYTTNTAGQSPCILDTIYLPSGIWLLMYNAEINSETSSSYVPSFNYNMAITKHTSASSGGLVIRQFQENVRATASGVTTSVDSCCNSFLLIVDITDETEANYVQQDDDITKNNTLLFGLTYLDGSGISRTIKHNLAAIKLKEVDDSDDTTLVEQVAENTAAIANLQSLDTDISSIRSQHENDVEELNTLIEDSVVSLRASLDEKSFSLDENNYLTLD